MCFKRTMSRRAHYGALMEVCRGIKERGAESPLESDHSENHLDMMLVTLDKSWLLTEPQFPDLSHRIYLVKIK